MRTKQDITYQLLDTYIEIDGTYNLLKLSADVMDFIYTDEIATEEQYNKDRDIKHTAYLLLLYYLNETLNKQGHTNFYATYQQLRKYNKKHSNCIDKTIDLLIFYISQNIAIKAITERWNNGKNETV